MSLPPEIPQPMNGANAQPEPEDQLQQVEREMTGFERGTLRWARVAVFMSALAAIFVCLQWWEMHTGGQDTANLAQAAKRQANAFIAVQRPFIAFRQEIAVYNARDIKGNRAYGIRLGLDNSGYTPTKDLTIHVNADWRPGALPKDFSYPDLGDNGFVRLSAGAKSTIYAAPIFVPQKAMEDVAAHKMQLTLYGWARYRDQFPDTTAHLTEFCYQTLAVQILPKGSQAVLAVCPEHNCADEECTEEKSTQNPN